MNVVIRNMEKNDWVYIEKIYSYAIEEVESTFKAVCPTYMEFDTDHHQNCRYVACVNNEVVGFLTLMPTSTNVIYSGVAEVSVYIDVKYRGKGIGYKLMKQMLLNANKFGYWSIYSAIFSNNEGSIKLHEKCGYRLIGYKEKLAKDKLNRWRDVSLFEYRYKE